MVSKVPASNVETDTKCRSRGDSRPDVVVDTRARKKGESRALRLDLGLVDEHDGKVIPNRINATAPRTLQALGILTVFKLRLASRANQHFQKFFGQHDFGIIEGTAPRGQRVRNRDRTKKYGVPAGIPKRPKPKAQKPYP